MRFIYGRSDLLKLFFAIYFLVTGFSLFAQDANPIAANPGNMLHRAKSGSVPRLNSLQKVDSIAQTSSAFSHFARVYSESMQKIAIQAKTFDTSAQAFIARFEIYFADYFLNAFDAYQDGILPDTSEWRLFFSNPDIQYWQLVLFGVNAHTNIDLSLALIHNFSGEEIKKYKHELFIVQRSIAEVYNSFFEDILEHSSYLKFINSLTRGFSKIVGERWVYKWRKRNIKLAILYFDHPEKFRRKLAHIHQKKDKIDKLILNKTGFLF